MILDKFLPKRYYDSAFLIDIEDLLANHIKGMIVDLDNTIIPWNALDTPKHLHDWLEHVANAGIKVCIVTNRNLERANIVGNNLALPVIGRAWKPRKKPFRDAAGIIGTLPSQTAVVGDQIFTDILGGNRAGMFTILVVPIGEKELPTTRILRSLERIILRKFKKSP